jgi:NAD(P)-dependent dehydrogenase (short-subunit alcohol dehydrogenase family)
MASFTGRVVLITGGTSGIGAAIAEVFLLEGASVIAVGRNKYRGQLQGFPRFESFCFDVTSPAAIAGLRELVEEDYERLDVLVNCAGVAGERMPLAETSAEDWANVFATNVTATFEMMKALTPILSKSDQGRIINIASTAGIDPLPRSGAYSPSKAAVISLSRLYAHELATQKSRITCNVVCPGLVKTRMTENIPKEAWDAAVARIPTGRTTYLHEVAELVLYIAKSDSNKQVFRIDGGMRS